MKTVFLTGASSGLGICIANTLLENGYFVILHYFKNREKVLNLYHKYPNSSLLIQGDISKEKEIQRMKKDLENHNIKIDVLINNAAIEHLSNIEEKNEETFLNVFKVNTLGAFYMIKYFGNEINERKGAILNISSDNAIDKYDVVTMEYDVSKSGLNILTKSFAAYFQDAYINAIAFGWLDTPMNDFPEDIKKSLNFVPLKKASAKILEMIESKESGTIEVVR